MGDNNHWQRIRSPAAAGAGETKPTNTNQDNRSSWWDYAAGASALLIFASGFIYVLGLFTLWTPIAMTKTDYLTAWHAASLVPKTVVAGLGVQQLVAFPLLAGTLIFIILFALNKLGGPRWGLTATMLVLYLLVAGFSVWRIATRTSSSLSKFQFPEVFGSEIFVMSPEFSDSEIFAILVVVATFIALYYYLFQFVRRAVHVYRTRTWGWSATTTLNHCVGFVCYIILAYWIVPDIASVAGIDYLINAAIIVGAGTIVWLGAVLWSRRFD